MNIRSKYQPLNCLGALAAGTFLALVFMTLTPKSIDAAQAEEASATINVHAQAAVSIALEDNQINMEITPKNTGSFNSKQTTVQIETNNTSGYQLHLGTSNNQNSLTNTKDESKTIQSITGQNVAPADFAPNTWGYNLDTKPSESKLFHAVPGHSIPILNTESANLESPDTYTLSFGANINTKLPAGIYTNQIVLSAVANPLEVTNLMDLVYMQDMTPELCLATPINDDLKNPLTKQLIDTRDGKSYYVAKLVDGNCWMTQNLDLDITEKMIAQSSLNTFTTDLHSGNVWGVNSATSTTDSNNTCGTDSETLNCQVIDNKAHYAPFATNIVNQTHLLPDAPFGQTWTSTMSWDVGKWVIKNPTTSFSCEAMYSMEECATATGGVVDVSGPEWKGTWSYDKNNSAVNNDTHEYDPHYLTGNYYQWN